MTKEEKRQETESALGKILASYGEDLVAEILSEKASGTLILAVSRLHSSKWWMSTLKEAVMNKGTYDSALLCKLLDKLMASPAARKENADDEFRLIIEHSYPQENSRKKKGAEGGQP